MSFDKLDESRLIDDVEGEATEMEFQSFMLSSAEADLVAGRIPTSGNSNTGSINTGRVGSINTGGVGSITTGGVGGTTGGINTGNSTFNSLGMSPSRDFTGNHQSQGQYADTRVNVSDTQPILPQSTPEQSQQQTTSAFWRLEYWKHYFRVRDRILATVLPSFDFLELLSDNPDFYGPFWVPTTVIFVLFATSTVAESIKNAWNGKSDYNYDMRLLSFAAVTIYSFVLALPALIYAISKYYNSSVKLFHLINVYGYGIFIWIPAALLCIIPLDILRWVIVAVALASTSFFHYSAVGKMTDAVPASAKGMIATGVVIGQVGLGLTLKLVFFQQMLSSGK